MGGRESVRVWAVWGCASLASSTSLKAPPVAPHAAHEASAHTPHPLPVTHAPFSPISPQVVPSSPGFAEPLPHTGSGRPSPDPLLQNPVLEGSAEACNPRGWTGLSCTCPAVTSITANLSF